MLEDISRTRRPGNMITKQSSYYFRQMGETIRIKPGTVLLKPGEIPAYCYYIRNGRILAGINSKDGDERILFVFEKNSLVLEQYLLTSSKSQLYFIASKETLVQKISYQELVRGMKSCFYITMDVMNAVVGLQEHSLYRMISDLEGNATVKICDQLLDLADAHGSMENNEILINERISQAMLGKLTGVHRVTVNREMKKLKEQGLIFNRDGYYCISNMDRLIQYRNEQSEIMN